MAKEKIELSLQDESGQECVAYPFVESTDVSLSNGMDIETMIAQDVSLPTIVHSETSFKAGVGDSNISSSIVDSSVAEMTIKGKTYQNILPEPSTHVLSNNKEMFKVNEGLDPNVEIVDGVSKSAILSGNTLVNLCDDGVADASDIERFTHNYTSNGGTFEQVSDGIKATTTQDNTWLIVGYDIRSQQKKTMTIGKKYYGVADVTIHKLSNSDSCKVIFRAQYGLRESKSLTNGRGLVQSVFTHSSVDANYGWLSVGTNTQKAVVGDSFTIHSMSVYEITEEEVNLSYEELANKYPVKCVGMQSVKMPVLTTIGKNLFDFDSFKRDENRIGTGGAYSSFEIKLKPNTQYSFNRFTNDGYGSTCYFAINTVQGSHLGSLTWLVHSDNQNINYQQGRFTTDNTGIVYISGIFNDNNLNKTFELIQNLIIVESNTIPTTYEPYKTNILSTSEDVVLRGIGDVQDTLDCLTGEKVERVGEVVLDGSENWVYEPTYTNENVYGCYILLHQLSQPPKPSNFNFANNVFPNITNSSYKSEGFATNPGTLSLRIAKTKLETVDLSGFKKYLQNNPVTLQYPLATESVKTVDLSSSGNWEKRALDGTETNWRIHNAGISTHTCFACELPNLLLQGMVICNEFKADNIWNVYEEKIMTHSTVRQLYLNLDNSRGITTVSKLKEYLSQNPITIWYQTQNHLDSTQVKQPIFFKDGHIQLSSGTDNSLIPTLDYQAKTSNSYVMDLMKPNTIYTMKLKGGNGAFVAQGGQSIGFMVNRTFNSGNLPNDKLFYTTGWVNDLMILEGDLTSKTIPYFKGIKSAFEDESKIEVLSTGKNLFDINYFYKEFSKLTGRQVRLAKDSIIMEGVGNTKHDRVIGNIKLKPNTVYKMSCNIKTTGDSPFATYEVYYNDALNRSVYLTQNSQNGAFRRFTTESSGIIQVRLDCPSSNNVTEYSNIYIVEDDGGYESYKSNNTKIPLLSPLRSLPNGTCDEVILDRENHKVKIIQRVGKVMVTTPQVSKWYMDNNGVTNVSRIRLEIDSLGARKSQKQMISNLVPATGRGFNFDEETTYMDDAQNYWLWLHVSNNRLPAPTIEGFKSWLSQNPLVTYYELETPIITEVDLSGYPYIYKDGHIFLNSEIAPVTEIKYSINQSHMIEASNQNIIRHQKEIDYLYKLIGEYVRVDYKNTLLALNLELK